MKFEIEKARAEDADDVLHLVEANRLTTDGLLDHLPSILVARLERRIVGTAALELYADGALLRSVAVAADVRGCGLGTSLTKSALRMANELGACDVYLLTFTAEQYFQRFGFRSLDRREVPPSVRESVQFTRACPSNAVVMRKQLGKRPTASRPLALHLNRSRMTCCARPAAAEHCTHSRLRRST